VSTGVRRFGVLFWDRFRDLSFGGFCKLDKGQGLTGELAGESSLGIEVLQAPGYNNPGLRVLQVIQSVLLTKRQMSRMGLDILQSQAHCLGF
jgi:hypothetical protein